VIEKACPARGQALAMTRDDGDQGSYGKRGERQLGFFDVKTMGYPQWL
jgi:hypothetical protein